MSELKIAEIGVPWAECINHNVVQADSLNTMVRVLEELIKITKEHIEENAGQAHSHPVEDFEELIRIKMRVLNSQR